jgi:hypothetical protein
MTGIVGTSRLLGTAAVLVGMAAGVAGCGALDVSDPTAIEDDELNNPQGAALLRAAALRALSSATDDGAYNSGLLADEFLFILPPGATPQAHPDVLLDRRESRQYEATGFADGGYGPWQQLRTKASQSLPKLRAYAPAPEAKAAEALALRAFATLRLAEDFCPAFPLHEVVDYKVIYGAPHSTQEAFERALADLDSAVTAAADSARILHLAKVWRARTLLGLGRVAEAAAAVEGVPTDYVAMAEYFVDPAELTGTLWNTALAFEQHGFMAKGVANQEGGTGLDFIGAADPRVQVTPLGLAVDGVTELYGMGKYPDENAPIVIASGIEARLVEAEAALEGGGDWLGILNALRTTCIDAAGCPAPAPAGSGGVAGLPPLTDPGTEASRVDLLFRERAFWLFGTGHRLADLRRLVRDYGRPAESVFPTGAYHQGGAYGAATSIPFPAAREVPYSPAVTGCTSR